jgi:uncharacterized protein YndB with AHSA1/START domain
MIARETYTPGPATGARIQKDGETWTLVFVRELRHPREKVWQALTDPAQLREWAPFEIDGNLEAGGTVKLTWVGTPQALELPVTRIEAPRLLEYGNMRWELAPAGGGTRLTLWATLDRRYIAMGAAGWHVAFDILDHLLAGSPIGRIAGGEAVKFSGWQRLHAEYAKQFNTEWPTP